MTTGNVAAWLALTPQQHAQKPNFIATLTATLQPFADITATALTLPSMFDINSAVGQQLDFVGQFVGITRYLSVPVTGVYFSWGTSGLGWGQANWAPTANPSKLTALPDANYRLLLLARGAFNRWDGTKNGVNGAYAVWAAANTGYVLLIDDYMDMHVSYALGSIPDAVTYQIFIQGLLTPKPAGVRIDAFWTPSVNGLPYFAWNLSGSLTAGWGIGYWGTRSPGI
jgi:hypothetical protein